MPIATVAAIIVKDIRTPPEKVVLTLRACKPFENKWCLPGGHIGPNEHARDAIIREVKEETNLDFRPKFFQYFDEIIPDEGIHAVVIVFTGHTTGEENAHSVEVASVDWFSLDVARSKVLAFKHNAILDKFIARQSQNK